MVWVVTQKRLRRLVWAGETVLAVIQEQKRFPLDREPEESNRSCLAGTSPRQMLTVFGSPPSKTSGRGTAVSVFKLNAGVEIAREQCERKRTLAGHVNGVKANGKTWSASIPRHELVRRQLASRLVLRR